MKYEKPQKGNPRGLVIKQHIFPLASIRRFVDDSGLVQLFLVEQKKMIHVNPDNDIFCAKRVWDQRAEKSYMKEIEDRYQELAESLCVEKRALTEEENLIVTDFYALWNIRFWYSQNPSGDQRLGVESAMEFTKENEELLEKNQIGLIRANGTVSSRLIDGGKIQIGLLEARKQWKSLKWGMLRAEDGELIVPDNCLSHKMVPLTPTMCFLAGHMAGHMSRSEVAALNILSKKLSRAYYFARDFSGCPS